MMGSEYRGTPGGIDLNSILQVGALMKIFILDIIAST
jgi:hypothetical protein